MTEVLFCCSFEKKILSYMYKYLPCTMYRSLSKILWITRKIRSQFFVADEYHAWGKWGKWRILLEDLTTEQSSSQQLQMHYFQYFSFIKWEISNTIFLKKEIKDIFCKNLTKLGNKNKCPLHYRTGFANIYQSAICFTKLCKFFFFIFRFIYTFCICLYIWKCGQCLHNMWAFCLINLL